MSNKTEAGPVALALALAVLRGDREALLMCHQHPITKKVDVDARYHLARYDEAIAGLEALAAHPPAQEQPAPAWWVRDSEPPHFYAPAFHKGPQPPAPLTEAEARTAGWRPFYATHPTPAERATLKGQP